MTLRYKPAPQSQPRRTKPVSVHCVGFTLIELLVSLAVLGLALSLIASYKPPWSRGLGLRATAAELAAGLRLARSEAGMPRHLPPDLSLELLTISGEALNGREGTIRFNPDGSSTGGRISLADGRRRIGVGVDWLTGRVSVADER
jgi:general secretion pathway protein H